VHQPEESCADEAEADGVFVTILGKRWRLLKTRMSKKYYGHCDHPDAPNKTIKIHSGLSDQKELDVCLHEFLHAADWHRSEEFVDQVATDMARALWRMGWRKSESE
jgi:hypothetical protein